MKKNDYFNLNDFQQPHKKAIFSIKDKKKCNLILKIIKNLKNKFHNKE